MNNRRYDRLTSRCIILEKKNFSMDERTNEWMDGWGTVFQDRSRAKTRDSSPPSPSSLLFRLRSSLPFTLLLLSILQAYQPDEKNKRKMKSLLRGTFRMRGIIADDSRGDRLSVIAIVTSTDVKKRFLSSFPQRQFLRWPDSWWNRCLDPM